MNRLLDIGFQPVGHWALNGDELGFQLLRHASKKNVLYAFVSDGEVKYIGKTTQPLSMRLNGYRNPGSSQSTNQKNKANIRALLKPGAAVDILVLPDDGLMHYGQLHSNLAAGLEDSIIAMLRPEWNGRDCVPRANDKALAKVPESKSNGEICVSLTVQKTYLNTGFFNIGVSHESLFGGDGEEIEIYCGDSNQPVLGYINRRANSNHTPRIMGGTGLRNWFQQHLTPTQEVQIDVLSPTSIRIRC